MINFSPSFIIDYIENHYGFLRLTSCGEFTGPGPESEDGKEHLWVNSETGLWQDFKTGKAGNFMQLVAYLDKTDHSSARMKVMRSALDSYSIKVGEEAAKKKQEERFKPLDFFDILDLEPVTKGSLNKPHFKGVREFLKGRYILKSIEDFPLYLSVGDPYPNRLIIPFIENGRMTFFQARALGESKAKYLTPSKGYGVRSTQIVYPFSNEPGRSLFITEGPLKARLLQWLGFKATSVQGSKLGIQQARIILRNHKGEIVLSFDNDEAGDKGQENAFGLLTRKLGVDPNKIFTCRPLKKFNDWEDFWVHINELAPSDAGQIFVTYFHTIENLKNMGKMEHLIDQLSS